jgi:hypothetical protein
MKLTVDCGALRRALTAVAPHADPDAEVTVLHRVRVAGDGPAGEVVVSATNRYTAAQTRVPMLEWDDDAALFDLLPDDARRLMAVFTPERGHTMTLELDAGPDRVRVTDVSGMFPGLALDLPAVPSHDRFPDLGPMTAAALNDDPSQVGWLAVDGGLLALFGKAAKAYTSPLILYPVGDQKPIGVTCGQSFAGVLMPVGLSSDEQDATDAARARWIGNRPADPPPQDEKMPLGVPDAVPTGAS